MSNDSQWQSDQVTNRHAAIAGRKQKGQKIETHLLRKHAASFHLLTLQTQHLILLQHDRCRILLKIQLFCGVTRRRWTNCYRSFEGSWCPHLQRQAVHEHFLRSVTSSAIPLCEQQISHSLPCSCSFMSAETLN